MLISVPVAYPLCCLPMCHPQLARNANAHPTPHALCLADPAVPERWRPGYLFGLAAQPDGPLLGAACSDGRLRLWTLEGGDAGLAPLCTLPWNRAMGADCVFGRNGLFCAVSKDGSVIMMVGRGWAGYLALPAQLNGALVVMHSVCI